MTLLMGVLNVTADSFSDGGRYLDPAAAVAHGLALVDQGASIVDVGGESTRPGAARVAAAEELRRVLPVVAGLAAHGVRVSVDTMRAEVAAAAVAQGASIVNDVSGGLADRDMHRVVAEAGVDYVLMHWRGHSDVMQRNTNYIDVVSEVAAELVLQRDRAIAAGIAADRIILDPGIGFAKTSEQNWQLLRELDRLQQLGHRVLLGVSRKRFLGELLAGREPGGRDVATAALSGWAAWLGLWAVRTHEIAYQRDVLAVVERLQQG
ncbi:MAG: dihydropteroate synthase [Propionibacterium sp.]|nr:MAG: dihydropteroate synthase [Propionibacterium sp.]